MCADLVASEVNVPQLSAALNVAYGINTVVVKNERLKLATGRQPLYSNWTGRGEGMDAQREREGRIHVQCMLHVGVLAIALCGTYN